MGRNHRPDVSTREVAVRWLAGESILTLATSYDMSRESIRKRLLKAHETMPDLPWDGRPSFRGGSPTSVYVRMRDGRGGVSIPKTGSIVKGRHR